MSSPARFNLHSPRGPRRLSIEAVEPRLLFAVDLEPACDVAGEPLSFAGEPLLEAAGASSLGNFSASAALDTRGLTGAGQTVVVIDSGIAWDHVAFGGGIGPGKHIVGGWDFAENDADPYDDGPMGTHGTHVAGILGSLDPRYPGLAPGAHIAALRVFDDQGQGDFPRIEAALRWVHDNRLSFANPITTVNLSLGARWNADGAPQWAIIEDELAQLEADGIFIAVAAGNSFAKFEQQVGVAYPAASSHVVPVASVDADGSLSNFSQRSDRVLAAPGRNVMSAVPDYAGNFNYRADDFLVLSGTSMAAPHVAAASMLVREAFGRAGRSVVTQADIYEVLRTNADTIYDPITGQSYRVLNVARALDAVLADVGGAPPTSQPPAEPAPQPLPMPSVPPPEADVADWGRIDSTVFQGQSFVADAQRNVLAANSGILTIEVIASTGQPGSAALYDASGNLLATATPTAGGLRLDAEVAAGRAYRIHFAGVGSSVDVRLTNLVRIHDSGVYVFGTPNDDDFAFAAGTTHEIAANGTRYEIAPSAARRVYLFGGAGHDRVSLAGTSGYDAAALRPGKVSLRTSNVLVLARDFESATIDGRAGQDVAFFADSRANESFTAWGDRAELVGADSRLLALGFESIRARSFGGQDSAALHAASATDRIAYVGASTRLIGANLLREVTGFQSVATFGAAPLVPLVTSERDAGVGAGIVEVSPSNSIRHSAPAHDDLFRRIGRQAAAPAGEAAARVLESANREAAGQAAFARLANDGIDFADRGVARWTRLAVSVHREVLPPDAGANAPAVTAAVDAVHAESPPQ